MPTPSFLAHIFFLPLSPSPHLPFSSPPLLPIAHIHLPDWQHSAWTSLRGLLQHQLAWGPLRGDCYRDNRRESHPSRLQPWQDHADILTALLPALQQRRSGKRPHRTHPTFLSSHERPPVVVFVSSGASVETETIWAQVCDEEKIHAQTRGMTLNCCTGLSLPYLLYSFFLLSLFLLSLLLLLSLFFLSLLLLSLLLPFLSSFPLFFSPPSYLSLLILLLTSLLTFLSPPFSFFSPPYFFFLPASSFSSPSPLPFLLFSPFSSSSLSPPAGHRVLLWQWPNLIPCIPLPSSEELLLWTNLGPAQCVTTADRPGGHHARVADRRNVQLRLPHVPQLVSDHVCWDINIHTHTHTHTHNLWVTMCVGCVLGYWHTHTQTQLVSDHVCR